MQVADCKEERDPEGQPNLPSPAFGMLWWNGFGSQVPQTAFYTPAKSLLVDHPSRVPSATKQVVMESEQLENPTSQVAGHSQSESEGVLMGTTRLQSMPIHSGCEGDNGEKRHQCQSANPEITSTPIEYLAPHAQLEFAPSIGRAAYPYADPYFGGIMAAYGAQAMPYLHESRHRHAMKRARGCGGRFLNTKKMEESTPNTGNGNVSAEKPVQAGSSSGSEVLQSESGNMNSAQELHGASGMSGSEVTSISESSENGTSYQYSHANETYMNHYQHPNFHLSAFHPLSGGTEEGGSGQSGVILSGGSQQRVVVIQ